jgi:antitoxin (DNA-binding transcriptional repressor) of toxin-antitoxin stability system
MKKPIDVSVVQANFDELLDRASKGEYFLAQKDGIIMAAIIGYEEYEVLVSFN